MGDWKKGYLDCVNPERRSFIKKMTTAAFVIPAVVSVSMLDQKLDLSSANAASANSLPSNVTSP